MKNKLGMLQRIEPESDELVTFDERSLVPEKKAKLSDYFTLENKAALYTYDFGDNWQEKSGLKKSSREKKEWSILYALQEKSYSRDR